jgi:hypothetical protein
MRGQYARHSCSIHSVGDVYGQVDGESEEKRRRCKLDCELTGSSNAAERAKGV